jgi:hypothetical protein
MIAPFAAAYFLASCVPQSPHNMQKNNPLGPSFWIIPVPSDDDSLLARTFAKPPDTALTLEEQSAPNPCADKLQDKRESEMPNHYEDAIDTKTSANAGALLSLYGFSADVSSATHLLYKVNTSKRLARFDTSEYMACCKEKGCGWGYVAALVRGEGEYASAIESSAAVKGNYSVISGGVSRSFNVSNKRAIKGYIAAIIVAHNRGDAAQACSPDMVWAKIECVPKNMPHEKEELCKKGNPQASDPMWKDNAQMQGIYKKQQDDACSWLASHGGPSIAPATPPSAPPASSTTKAPDPPPPPTFEPGEYTAINSFWSGKLTFKKDGTFVRDNGDKGVWIFEKDTVILKWSKGNAEDHLKLSSPGVYKDLTGFFTIRLVPSN